MVQGFLGSMWKCNDPHLRPPVNKWLSQRRGRGIDITEDEAVEAVKALHHRHILDSLGCCPESVRILVTVSPTYLAAVLTNLAKSQYEWASITMMGKVKAKLKGPVPAAKLRTILPLPALVGAIDYVISKRLNMIAESMTIQIVFGFLGASEPYRQVLDIAFPDFLPSSADSTACRKYASPKQILRSIMTTLTCSELPSGSVNGHIALTS